MKSILDIRPDKSVGATYIYVMHKANMDFPPKVQSVLEQLKSESGIQSIWFIGSRANKNSRPDSDWDFICFIDAPIQVRKARCDLVDIVKVGSDGKYLLEGESIELAGQFNSWQWLEIDAGKAQYRNRVIPEVSDGVGFDLNEVNIITYDAFRVWKRNA